MEENQILIAALQETWLTEKSKVKSTPNYTLVRKDRKKKNTTKGGGLAFLVHKSVPFDNIKQKIFDEHTEELTIAIKSKDSSLYIRNIYIPPASSCPSGYTPPYKEIFENLGDTALVLGDFNAHHELWHSEIDEDTRGTQIADFMTETPFGILNEQLPTRVAHNINSSPDITFSTPNLLPTTEWTSDKALSSDHLPIHISLSTEIKLVRSEKRTFINFNKANWLEFTQLTEEIFEKATPTDNVHASEKFFRETVKKVARRTIPAGRIPEVYNNLPSESVQLMKERDDLRKRDPNNERIGELNESIKKTTNEHRKNKWLKTIEKCKQGTKELWNTIKSIQNPKHNANNQSIIFNGKTYHEAKDIANQFNKQYTPEPSTKPTKEFRNTLRQLKKKKDPDIVITPEQTTKAIKKSKNSKALGPDDMSPIMLKHLGPHGISYLTKIYNNVVNTATIPYLWKLGRIIPLHKPKKPASEGPSYRPISLLSPAAKLLESVLQAPITTAINLAAHQHGFRRGRSTTTALQDIHHHIQRGLNKRKPVDRTVVVAIDLSKAFDTVNHETLLTDIYHLNLNSNIKRFLAAYLRGRQTYVEFRNVRSKYRKVKQGVPQGGVLSPILFNLYMCQFPLPPGKMKAITYADDTNILNSGRDIQKLCEETNKYLDEVADWFANRDLQISPGKSMATLFTTFNNEMSIDLPIFIKGAKVPTVNQPTYLGIKFDNLITFRHHSELIKGRVQERNNILKALAGTSWGQDKETIVSTYKAISQSIINYGSPIFTPNLKDTNWNEIQVAQNNALRIATGCVKKTPIEHLHTECKIMPVKEHCEMLSKQFLMNSQNPNHPNNINLLEKQPRDIKKTLESRFGREISNLIPQEGVNDDNKKALLKSIHTDSVASVINRRNPNPFINERNPTINIEEKKLPRRSRVILAQLRSGYSTHLNSTMSIYDNNIQDLCPDCGHSPHNTPHLFACPAKPTSLTVKSLWQKPIEAANFLGLPVEELADE